MKNTSRSRIINIAVLLFLILFLFTPLGITIKVWINRIIAFSPSVIEKTDQKKIENYNWNLINEKGETISFEQYKDKVILVNFWATWCPPCIAEMPGMQKLYDDYKDKVIFLFIANDEEDKVARFMEKYKYTLPVYYVYNSVPEVLEARSIPVTYLIDQSGNIIVDKTGSADWNSDRFRKVLDELLK